MSIQVRTTDLYTVIDALDDGDSHHRQNDSSSAAATRGNSAASQSSSNSSSKSKSKSDNGRNSNELIASKQHKNDGTKDASNMEISMSREELLQRVLELESQVDGLAQVLTEKVPALTNTNDNQTNPDTNPSSKTSKKTKKKGDGGYVVKTPWGMRDFHPQDMSIREEVFRNIREVFKRHGGLEIDTPIAELKSTLTGKYGEDGKLIFDLAEQGEEPSSLRYDLTVPFARYCAEHSIKQMRRFHIGKVYRRDDPQPSKGRYREFYQCDWDAAGEFEPLLPDAECLKIASEILSNLDVGPFLLKLNHRKLLDGIFQICGVPPNLLRPICSAVDKLDKVEWTEIRKEMIAKGLDGETADAIYEYVQLNGHEDLIQRLLQNTAISGNETASVGVQELSTLLQYCKDFGVPMDYLKIDLSMARGLDYYTGVIYEGVLLEHRDVGSVTGGGRYDNLVGIFSRKNKKLPCVGVSIGVERLFSVVESRSAARKKLYGETVFRRSATDVLVISGQKSMFRERLRVCGELWAVGIRADTFHRQNPKLLTQYQRAEDEGIPLAVTVGEDEVSRGELRLRNIVTREEWDVKREEVITEINAFLAQHQSKGPAAAEAEATETAAETEPSPQVALNGGTDTNQ